MLDANVQPQVAHVPQYVVAADNRPQGTIFIPSYNLNTIAHVPVANGQSTSSVLQPNSVVVDDNLPLSHVVPLVSALDTRVQVYEVHIESDLVLSLEIMMILPNKVQLIRLVMLMVWFLDDLGVP